MYKGWQDMSLSGFPTGTPSRSMVGCDLPEKALSRAFLFHPKRGRGFRRALAMVLGRICSVLPAFGEASGPNESLIFDGRRKDANHVRGDPLLAFLRDNKQEPIMFGHLITSLRDLPNSTTSIITESQSTRQVAGLLIEKELKAFSQVVPGDPSAKRSKEEGVPLRFGVLKRNVL